MSTKVAILLSTFNGEKGLIDLLDSLANQEAAHLHLIWRDDGSSDETIRILQGYKTLHQIPCTHITERIGVAESYVHLLQHASEYDFIAFCDQDDVWESSKIKMAIEAFDQSPQGPLVYSSKVRILDSDKIWPDYFIRPGLMNSLFENIMIGCTIVMNSEFMDSLLKFEKPDELLHDEWIYLVSSIIGRHIFDQNSYIRYRIHSGNATGIPLAKRSTCLTKMQRFGRIFQLITKYKVKINYLDQLVDFQNDGQLSKVFDITKAPLMKRRIKKIRNERFRQNPFENRIFIILWRLGII